MRKLSMARPQRLDESVSTLESALFDIYIAGVEVRRGKLSKQERDELRNAWLAGYMAAQDRGDERG
jgi:hypothetical protein